MLTLSGPKVYLRALEPEDLEFVYAVENDETVWEISHTQSPYSRFLIREYLQNAQQDIYTAKQLRLAICKQSTSAVVGLIDLFEFDAQHLRAGVGILIKASQDRNEGFGSESLKLLLDYAFTHLHLHQLYANIDPENSASVKLFTNFGFVPIGTKKQWNRVGDRFKDETLFQLIRS